MNHHRQRHAVSTLLLASFFALSATGCALDEDQLDPTTMGPSEIPAAELLDEAPAEPAPMVEDATLIADKKLRDGAHVRFFAHDDGSISIIEEGDAYHSSVLAHPDFAEATAYDLFFAMTEPGEEIPTALHEYHQRMLADDLAKPLEQPRGWLLDESPTISKTPCGDSINAFVCGAGAAYPSGPGCWNNTTGSLAWYDNSQPMRRYRTGFCSPGTVNAVITYSYSAPSGCVVFRPLFILRNGQYNNTNWQYAWSGPSGTTPRGYSNSVSHVSGSGFAWGVREAWHTSSSCTI